MQASDSILPCRLTELGASGNISMTGFVILFNGICSIVNFASYAINVPAFFFGSSSQRSMCKNHQVEEKCAAGGLVRSVVLNPDQLI